MSVIVLDVNISTDIIWASRFSFFPFKCTGYASNDLFDLDKVVAVFRKIMEWRIIDPRSTVLIPAALIYMDWSALFCYYVRYINGIKIVSMGGDIEGFHLEPVDDRIRLFKASDNISPKWLKHKHEIVKVTDSIPEKDEWDWHTAATVGYLFMNNEYEENVSLTQPSTIIF
jgi:hypothetical protein